MTTEQITEALDWMERYDPSLNTTPIHPLSVVVGAARDHLTCLADWVLCPTCNGSGKLVSLKVDKTKHPMRPEPLGETVCPDCVDGLQPSPELIERVAEALDRFHHNSNKWDARSPEMQEIFRREAKAVLLASR